jgi:glycerol kinase
MAEHVVAIDQGTTGTSVMVFDSLGRLRSRAYAEVRQYHPRPGWVEHDADEIWTVTRKVTAAALRSARVRPKDIAAIGIANQRATAVLWDRVTGRPVQRAIVWQDRRTVPDCERLKAEGAEATIRAKTGLVVDPAFAATKVQWLLDHGPRLRARVHRLAFGTIDTWLIWKLRFPKRFSLASCRRRAWSA